MQPRFAITVTFEIDAVRLEEFMPLMHANARESVANEPGCLRFDVLQPESSGTVPAVCLYEVYISRQAFDDHLASRHFLHFDTVTKDMIKSKSIQSYQVFENIKLQS